MKVNFIFPLVILGTVLAPPLVRADPVLDWNNAVREAIRAARTDPPRGSRGMAILHAAIFDAVCGIQRTHHPYHVTALAPEGASVEAAVSGAAYTVLMNLYTNLDIRTTNFGVLYTNLVAAIPEGPAKIDGLAWGQGVAQAILELRTDDGLTNAVPYSPGSEPGLWQPTPPGFAPALLPQWAQLRCFTMTSGAQFRPHRPPALSSSAYALEVNLLKIYGAATGSVRTADQSEIAYFWTDDPGTETPPGHWNRIAAGVSAARGLSLAENARLFALLNLAMADAAICSWDAKFAYDFWRPYHAIREADTDGNPETEPDPNWTAFIFIPPFPEYTSGHSTFSRSAATVLADFFGTDAISFSTTSDGIPGVTRSYPGFSAAADESGISRIYGGIHFPSANIAGQTTGYQLGRYVATHFLTPLQAPEFTLVAKGGGPATLTMLGEPDQEYVLQVSPDLDHWQNLSTNTAAANGELQFVDPDAGTTDKRFYRAMAR